MSFKAKRFQNRVAESRMALPATCIYALCMSVIGCELSNQLAIHIGLLAITSVLMMELNNANALIRIYSRMVSCSFLVLAVMSQFLFADLKCGIAQACYVAFFLFFFSAYQSPSAVGRIFYAFVMLGIASMLFPQLVFFVPLIWLLLCTNIMVGSIRMLVASLLGLTMPYWFWAAYLAYTDIHRLNIIPEHFVSLFSFCPLSAWHDVPMGQVLTTAFVVLVSLIGIINFRLNNYKDKIRTRMLFEIFTIMSLCTILFIVLQPTLLHHLLGLLIVCTAPMAGHYIALTHSRMSNISFVLMLLFAFTITIINKWMLF